MNKNRSSVFIKTFLLILNLLFVQQATAQVEIKFLNKEKIKKENGLFGVKKDDKWTIPPVYNKIEGFGSYSGYLICDKNGFTDIYKINNNQELIAEQLNSAQAETFRIYADAPNIPMLLNKKWSGMIDPLTPQQKVLYETIKNNNIPYVKNNKWGFANKFYNIEPKYDSLYIVCLEDEAGTKNLQCEDLVGVCSGEKKGLISNDGREIILHKDYLSFQYKIFQDKNPKIQIIGRHISGIDVQFDKYDSLKNNYIEIKKDGLVGFVCRGDLVPPQYKIIRKLGKKQVDYECTRPDGTIEYRKGINLLSENEASAFKNQNDEEQKKLEAAAREIDRKMAIQKQQDQYLEAYYNTHRDSLKQVVKKVCVTHDRKTYEAMNRLNEFLKETLKSQGNDFDRTEWYTQSFTIRDTLCKESKERITAYDTDLKKQQQLAGKIELYDLTAKYLQLSYSFVAICEEYADFIRLNVGGFDSLKKLLGRMNTIQINLNTTHNQLRDAAK